jgi:hypothetical protein
MDPEQSSPPAAVQSAKPITGRLSPIFFLLGVVFFFLPFVDIRCNNVSLQQVSGINLATGFKIKTANNGSLFDNLDHSNNDDFSITKNGEERKLNEYALVALIIGAAGLIISLINFKGREILGVITGVGAAAALIGLMADIKSQVKLDLSAKTDNLNIRVAVDFTPWFYITVLVFLIGAFLSYIAIKRKSSSA